MKKTNGQKVFSVFNALFMFGLCFATLYPLWYVTIASFSDPTAVTTGQVVFWPVGFELASYQKVFQMDYLVSSYGNTIFYATFGTALNMLLTIAGAYPLSKRRLRGRKYFNFMILFTMWFNAGMMPMYLNFQSLGLLNTRVAILLCGAINTFNVILMRTYFENVPDAMEEAAKIDGANDFQVLTKVYLPLSLPAIATITMYYFVERWNSYFWTMILISDQTKTSLQVLLRRLIVNVSYTVTEGVDMSATNMSEQTIIYATILIAIVPMLIIYPFLQKFFTKGVMVGAIKG